MKYYAVIDTNVLVSSLLSPHPDSATVLIRKHVAKGDLVPLFNVEIFAEYRSVLARPKLGLPASLVAAVLDAINEAGLSLGRTASAESFPDPKDVVFYEIGMMMPPSAPAHIQDGHLLLHHVSLRMAHIPRTGIDSRKGIFESSKTADRDISTARIVNNTLCNILNLARFVGLCLFSFSPLHHSMYFFPEKKYTHMAHKSSNPETTYFIIQSVQAS